MRSYLTLHVVQIPGEKMIESGIDGISRGDTMGGMMRVLNHLQFVPLYKGVE